MAGHVPRRREPEFLKQITLVMGQKQQLLWDLPPAETFALNRAIYEIPRPQFEETLRELTTLLELGDLVSKPTRQLSLGERMKCELAAALLHRPRVLFLDEPTIGLDVSMQATVRELRPGLQRAVRRDRAPHQPLHGGRGPALPARHRDRPRPAHLRRRPARALAQDPPGQADRGAIRERQRRRAHPGGPRPLRRRWSRPSRARPRSRSRRTRSPASVARILGGVARRGPHRGGSATRGGDVGAVPVVAARNGRRRRFGPLVLTAQLRARREITLTAARPRRCRRAARTRPASRRARPSSRACPAGARRRGRPARRSARRRCRCRAWRWRGRREPRRPPRR